MEILQTGNLMITDACYLHQQSHFYSVRTCQCPLGSDSASSWFVKVEGSLGLWEQLSLMAVDQITGISLVYPSCLLQAFCWYQDLLFQLVWYQEGRRLRVLFYLLLVSIILKYMLRESNNNNIIANVAMKYGLFHIFQELVLIWNFLVI